MCGRILKKKYKVNSQPTSSSWLVKGSDWERRGAWHECDSWYMMLYWFIFKFNGTVADPGEGPGGPGPPIFLDQNEARRAEKKIFWGHLPPPPPALISGSGWLPPSIYLKVDPATAVLHGVEITEVRNWQDCLEKGELCGIRPPLLDFFRFSKSLPHNYW